ncbi:serine peptidase [Oleiphilus sp. HI0071]|jgi:serine protease Do|uniref:DegQ family serine endoprotease n=3 Tax=unclassified Oleiphilus TaxID=2631174 RepID=UPI0007C26BDD|nr:DegQ family serine endoprotease [Oleiphilus sp. HI0079]KZY62210.1 serine peptidase [Oleiphilus sp. HI0065]KZY81710.1 serine peptidase [Oleiphilus sp. HI0071]KZZ00834.1 serine peptidase [Oleiphilus sp. HI0073]KZZ48235.1 serine peptidase [Oleiphilus sp. HI0122]KZZ48438.1 serine peptidase [Oleiphilus sp. HI0118]KZZ79286.1 serine peptidase [Oleiphilus sp. HI0133]
MNSTLAHGMRLLVALVLSLSFVSANARSLPDFTELVEEHAPVVVNISTISTSKSPQSQMFQGDMEQIPDFLRHFFGAPAPYQDREKRQERQSMGSGFVVTDDGYILTNNHVIEGADEIYVRFNDRRELKAELIGSDKRSDLAVLKVEADGLPTAKLGKSKDLKVGEWVFAIGSPFGFDYSVTAGIVSAKGRSLPNENYVPFIQTDVAINPGNSGGPLFNMDGEVVGINSQIYTRSGGFMGMSFAIPMDVAMEVVDQLRGQGYVSRGWLGVLIQEVSKELAESFGLDKPHGALVAQVVPGSPAQEAGIQVGDIIVKYEDEKINLSSQLPHFVGRTKVGEDAELTVIRNGDRKTVKVEIGELPNSSDVPVKPAKATVPEANRLGVMVKELDDAVLKDAGLEGGVQVVKVQAGPASNAGIRQGDIIAKINNESFESLEDFEDIVDDLPEDKAIPVLVIRGGNPSFLVLKIEE